MRKLSKMLATGMLALALAVPQVAAASGVAAFKIGQGVYSINGMPKQDVAPYIKKGRTFLPLRFTAYAVGIGDNSIRWDDSTKTAYLGKGNDVIAVKVGAPILRVYTFEGDQLVKERTVTLDVPAEIKDGRVMLPLRAVAEAFGCQVHWDAGKQVVTVVSGD